jgi:hypothetical protein
VPDNSICHYFVFKISFDGLAKTIEAVASLFIQQEEPARATLLLAWAGDLRQKSRSIVWPMQGKHIDQELAKSAP